MVRIMVEEEPRERRLDRVGGKRSSNRYPIIKTTAAPGMRENACSREQRIVGNAKQTGTNNKRTIRSHENNSNGREGGRRDIMP